MTNATTTRHAGTFTIDSWDQHDHEPGAEGFTSGGAELTKTFSGDLTGTSRTRIMMIGTGSGTRGYCGFEQVTGTVAGRSGAFVLRHAAEGDADGQWMTWTVVAGSGTGELTGVTGEGQIVPQDGGGHAYWLDLAFA